MSRATATCTCTPARRASRRSSSPIVRGGPIRRSSPLTSIDTRPSRCCSYRGENSRATATSGFTTFNAADRRELMLSACSAAQVIVSQRRWSIEARVHLLSRHAVRCRRVNDMSSNCDVESPGRTSAPDSTSPDPSCLSSAAPASPPALLNLTVTPPALRAIGVLADEHAGRLAAFDDALQPPPRRERQPLERCGAAPPRHRTPPGRNCRPAARASAP